MVNERLETKIKDRLKKLSKEMIIELYLQARFEKDLPSEIEEEQPKHKFKVGDRVQFKSWEEMEKEFGLAKYGDIDNGFDKMMKHLCGTYATIKNIDNGKFFNVELKDFSAIRRVDWGFNLDMLKPATDEPKCEFKVGDRVLVNDLFWHNAPATVTEISNTDVYVRLDGHNSNHITDIAALTSYIEPRWTFTDDEKVILRNLPDEFKWIARDSDGEINIFENKPTKYGHYWNNDAFAKSIRLLEFNHLFQSIKWTDKEPCEFRKYL